MPSKSANVKNEKQYEKLKEKGMSPREARRLRGRNELGRRFRPHCNHSPPALCTSTLTARRLRASVSRPAT